MKIYDKITKGTGIIDHHIFRHLVYYIIKIFGLRKIHPNLIVLFNLLFASFCAYLISTHNYVNAIIGASLYLFFDMFDLIDGAVARLYGKTSKFGAFFDGLTDTIAESTIIISIGIYFSQLTTSTYLIIFIMLSVIINLRVKWILDEKENQLNILELKTKTLISKLKYAIILITRNDTRKIIIIIGLIINSFYLIMTYFFILYLLSTIVSINKIIRK